MGGGSSRQIYECHSKTTYPIDPECSEFSSLSITDLWEEFQLSNFTRGVVVRHISMGGSEKLEN